MLTSTRRLPHTPLTYAASHADAAHLAQCGDAGNGVRR